MIFLSSFPTKVPVMLKYDDLKDYLASRLVASMCFVCIIGIALSILMA
jgi:hypothetical protein